MFDLLFVGGKHIVDMEIIEVNRTKAVLSPALSVPNSTEWKAFMQAVVDQVHVLLLILMNSNCCLVHFVHARLTCFIVISICFLFNNFY